MTRPCFLLPTGVCLFQILSFVNLAFGFQKPNDIIHREICSSWSRNYLPFRNNLVAAEFVNKPKVLQLLLGIRTDTYRRNVSTQCSTSASLDRKCVRLMLVRSNDSIDDRKTVRSTEKPALANSASSTSKLKKVSTKQPSKAISASSNKTPRKEAKINEPIHWTFPSDIAVVVPRNDPMFDVASATKEFDTSDIKQAFFKGTYSMVRFTIRGNPLPLRRHRTKRGFVYNPSAAAQESFKTVVRQHFENVNPSTLTKSQAIPRNHSQTSSEIIITDDDDKKPTMHIGSEISSVLFESYQQLAMTVVFYMKRPKSHFVSSKAGPGRLRLPYNLTSGETVNSMYPTSTSDVDNLAKFVLDSLNGVLYEDDRQVISLHAIKVYDDFCPTNENCCLGSTEICIRAIDTASELRNIMQRSFHSLSGDDE